MDMFLGLIRHVLTFLAGLLVAKGMVDETLALELVAAIMGVVGIVWSIYDKKQRLGVN